MGNSRLQENPHLEVLDAESWICFVSGGLPPPHLGGKVWGLDVFGSGQVPHRLLWVIAFVEHDCVGWEKQVPLLDGEDISCCACM